MGFSLNRAEQGETPFEQYETLYREMVARVSHHVLELLHDAPDGQTANSCCSSLNRWGRWATRCIPC